MLIDVKDGIFEVNTSESYNKDIYIIGNNLIIPYINLQISDIKFAHYKVKRYDKLDFSYLIFKNVKELLWNCGCDDKEKFGKLVLNDLSDENDYLVDYISGLDLFSEHYGCEFEVIYKEQYLYFLEEVNVKNGGLGFWVPIDTPNFRKNMADEKVQSFFRSENVPKEILELVGEGDFEKFEILQVL